jgi:hypothetical protein
MTKATRTYTATTIVSLTVAKSRSKLLFAGFRLPPEGDHLRAPLSHPAQSLAGIVTELAKALRVVPVILKFPVSLGVNWLLLLFVTFTFCVTNEGPVQNNAGVSPHTLHSSQMAAASSRGELRTPAIWRRCISELAI